MPDGRLLFEHILPMMYNPPHTTTPQTQTMTQQIIRKKLTAYLDLISSSYPDSERAMTHQVKQSLIPGHCFGLSACFGIMHLLDKLGWWQAALKTITNWDESMETLCQPIRLPGTQNNQTMSRENIFERVLNYIIFTQATHLSSLLGQKKINQGNVLNELEILDRNGKIKKLILQENMSGYFTKQDLSVLLDVNDIEDSFCILSQGKHSVAILYKNNQWLFYNSNHSHSCTDTMCVVYETQSEIIDKITRALGHTLSIKIASFNKKELASLNYYHSLVRHDTKILLRKHGLFMIARDNPHQLPNILSALEEMPNGYDLLAQALAVSRGKTHVLSLIFRNVPHSLSRTLKLLSQSSMGPNTICEWLTESVFSQIGGAHHSQLFAMAAQSDQCPHYLARHMVNHALKEDQYSIVQPILTNASAQLKEILMQDMLEDIYTFPQMINLLKVLPEDYESRIQLATKTISYFLNRVNSPKKIHTIINQIEANKEALNFLFERPGIFTTVSLSGNCWKGEAVSGAWVNIIHIAKERMVTLLALDNLMPVSDADIRFLRAKTAERSFFSHEIDYYQRYREMLEENYKLRPNAISP